ncbi:hypothetical protein Poly51_30950 [Rubripirellula tenax]|uniref:Uncharacterized protein n=1 Tax=Rubripirellula tenax TaxID=2528015 RepID=A0A5C6EYZ7_9BACT|nr:hypothetical protein [Rubripirellula tenax]TWU54378.1 hypothetical protein Poly51_30950 [Rubripirellula tenax]
MFDYVQTAVVGDFNGWRRDVQYLLRNGMSCTLASGLESRSYRHQPEAALLVMSKRCFLSIAGEGRREVLITGLPISSDFDGRPGA